MLLSIPFSYAADVIVQSGKLNVSDTITVSGFKMPTSAQSGYVLTSDGTGVGSWQQIGSAQSGGGWYDDGTKIHLQTVTDLVGIGTQNPAGELHVAANYPSGANFTFSGHVFSMKGKNDPATSGYNLPFIEWRTHANERAMYLGWGSSTAPKFVDLTLENGYNLNINGGNVGIGTTGPTGKLHVSGSLTVASGGAASILDTSLTPANNAPASLMKISGTINEPASINANSIFAALTIAPTFSGTFANQPGAIGLDIQSFSGGGGTKYGMRVAAPTGGDNNYAAVFTGGNVGIGTTTPGSKLQIRHASESTITSLGAIADSELFLMDTGNNNVNELSQILFGRHGGTYAPAAIGSISTSLSGVNNAAIIFATRSATTDVAPTERMRIDKDGYVGIGTTDPQSKLQINDGHLRILHTGGIGTFADFQQFSGWALRMRVLSASTHIGIDVTETSASSGRSLVLQQTGGNVGIGTTGPTDTLHVKQSTSLKGIIVEGTDPQITFDDVLGANVDNFRIWNNGQTAFFTDSTDNVNIITLGLTTNQGNVGIGTTPTSNKLDVSGNIHATGDICTDAGGGKCLSTGGGGISGSGSTNYIPKFTGATSIGNSVIVDGTSYVDISADTLYLGSDQRLQQEGSWMYVRNDAGSYGGKGLAADNLWANSNSYSRIFYDVDNTGYYTDPAGTSSMNMITQQTKVKWGLNGLYNTPRSDYSGSTAYWGGIMGWGNTDFNTIFSNWGSGFFDTWGPPANAPGGSSHYVGIQAGHYFYQNGYNVYGFQIAVAGESDNRMFFRTSWNTPRSWVEFIHSGNIGSQSVNYASSSGSAGGLNTGQWSTSGDDLISNGWGHIYTTSSNLHLTSYSGEMYLNYYYNNWVNIGHPSNGDGYLRIGNSQIYDNNGWLYIESGANNRIYTPNYFRIDDDLEVNANIYWGTNGIWLSSWLNQNVRSDSSPTFSNMYIGSGGRIYFNGGTTYGIGTIGNYHSGTFDTLDSGSDSDPLELVYYRGASVRIGPSGGTKPIYASAFYYGSDERLKKDIESVKGLDIIREIKGVKFRWNSTNEPSVGLVAQNVEPVLPEAVSTDEKSGMKSVNYGALVAPLIESVKELDEKDTELESKDVETDKKIALLEQEIRNLKKDLEELKLKEAQK